MAAKLVSIGDSLSHGFQHAAIRRSEWSYPALVARALGAAEFRQSDFSGGGTGGPLIDLELLMQRLSQTCGKNLDLWDLPAALVAVHSLMDKVEDYWERGPGIQPSDTGPIHHNLAVWGFDVLDAQSLSDGVCRRHIGPPKDNVLAQIPESAMYRSARRVFNPAQVPDFAEQTPLRLARTLAEREGGIENLLLELGANNALGTCVRLEIEWSEAADFDKLAHERSCTLWRPEHFSRLYRTLAEQAAEVGAERVFLTTVPHVTIAPVVRGVSPGATPGHELEGGYYEYYTRFWIWDHDFDPRRHPHLSRAQAQLIDRTIDEYNACIVATARERGWHVIDLCQVLDDLAFRRNSGAPSYELPSGLVTALGANQETKFRVRPDGSVLLDTRYLRIPDRPPATDAPADTWRNAYKGGLFGLDGAHPTSTGYGLIAHEVLKAMRAAGVTEANPERLPWTAIVGADSLLREPPAILASLARTLDVIFGKFAFERVINKIAGLAPEKP